MKTLLVRLKPYDPKAGNVRKRYSIRGIMIDVERGWHRVPADIAEELRLVRQHSMIAHSPFAFDVCTEAEAEELEERERAEAEARRSATSHIPVSRPRDLSEPPKGTDGDLLRKLMARVEAAEARAAEAEKRAVEQPSARRQLADEAPAEEQGDPAPAPDPAPKAEPKKAAPKKTAPKKAAPKKTEAETDEEKKPAKKAAPKKKAEPKEEKAEKAADSEDKSED